MKNALRQLEVILYKQKRRWGRPVSVFNKIDSTINYETMTKEVQWDHKKIRRVIILSSREAQQLLQLEELKLGAFNKDERYIIIDGNDCRNITIDDHTEFEFDNRRYTVVQYDSAYENKGYIIKVKTVKGTVKVGG